MSLTHLMSVVDYLDKAGLIDSKKISVSGWSRDAFQVEGFIIDRRFPFAAAVAIDGGDCNYIEGCRPWWTEELRRIQTPYLKESHQRRGIGSTPLFAALRALGKPAEFLLIQDSPHGTTNPVHRWRSLNAHTDWIRFWLQNYEDPDPQKAEQYRRWRELRKLQQKNETTPISSKP